MGRQVNNIKVELIHHYSGSELEDLCSATTEAIRDGIGFNWLEPPSMEVLEKYWRGVLVVPERSLFLGKIDNMVAGAIQLLRPGPSKQSKAFAVKIQTHFVTPWARGHGLAKELLQAAERYAILEGFEIIRLDVRSTQERAIALYESQDYHLWGILEKYERVAGLMIPGRFYWKDLRISGII
jgi:ribosomal protein S18 acetylase RimI-like enzyme